jgi:Cytochrome domain of cellobiose dehydrogenase
MPISDIDLVVQSTSIQNSIMTANIICRNCTKWADVATVDMTSAKQPWIYAAGPGEPVSSSSPDANIAKHTTYGTLKSDSNHYGLH